MTGIFFDPATDRIYYTLSGQSSLFYRSFLPESHVIGAIRSTATGNIAGAEPEPGARHVPRPGPDLVRRQRHGQPAEDRRSPVASSSGTATVADNTTDWRSPAMFLATNAQPNVPPTADFTPDCTINVCDFDGSASIDSDGDIVSYAWDFGDGGTATGPIVNHPYAAAGTYTVTLTVVDDRGGIDDHQIDVTVDDPPNVPPTAVLEADCTLLTCSFDASDSGDSRRHDRSRTTGTSATARLAPVSRSITTTPRRARTT